MALANQLACFQEDSQLRNNCLHQRGVALDYNVATPFFENFKHTPFERLSLPSNVTPFGSPTPLYVEQTLDTFKALFRHFCYGLGNDLSLPKGAFYAGSSCVAALASSLSNTATQTRAVGAERANQLAVLEGRVQNIMREPLVLRTIAKCFKETSLAQKVMEYAHDPWSLKDFHREVEDVLQTSTPDLRWDLADDFGDLADDFGNIVHSSFYYDQNGLGPYARSDVDIMVVAQTEEEASAIIQNTLNKIKSQYGNCRVYKTPCSVQVIGDFPLRHVQIITVINKSLDEYMLFCDLDCTALAFDGQQLYGSRRAYLALNSGYNIVPQEMLENRNDTPRRLHKYNKRGFASVLPGDLTETAMTLLGQAESISEPNPFFDVERWELEEDKMIAHLSDNSKRNASCFYTETNLPRGYGITADVANAILTTLQTQARLMGRRTVVSEFNGLPDVIFKMTKTPENWVRWGLANACVEADEPTGLIDVPSTLDQWD